MIENAFVTLALFGFLASPVVPLGLVILGSAVISLIRAIAATREAPVGLRFVRGARVVLVAFYLISVGGVLFAMLLYGAKLQALWLPVVVLALGELAIPHYFANRESDGRAESASPGSAGISKIHDNSRIAPESRVINPLLLTVVTKSAGLIILSANLVEPALSWSKLRLAGVRSPDVLWPLPPPCSAARLFPRRSAGKRSNPSASR